MRKMTEGRKSQIVLLDERRLDIIVQPKLHSYELLDLVSSHFKLREKQYFGLGFIDDTNHFTWLQADKRVLDHDFPKKTGLLVLYFSIRFYVETIGLLRDIQTVELFYLNARQVLFKGPVECDSETVFELAAHVLQATNGDLVSGEETREELKKLPLIPTSTLREHPSIAYCEDRVICHYEKLAGTSRGLAIVNYMTIIENIPTYGIHFFEVKDKKDIPWWLGISPKGIAVYDRDDRKTPRKLFTWKNLENLYYRDRKFSIEVSGSKRITHTLSSLNPYEDAIREPVHQYDQLSSAITDPSTQVSVSRRTFGASNVDVHAWFAVTAHLAKSIWTMAVAQHQFYLDRKQSRSQLQAARSMSEIAADLCRSTASLPGSLGSDLSRSPSSHSLPSLSNSRYDLTIEQSDSLKAEREMVKALKARKEALEEALAKKTEELKRLCFDEAQLTGVLPNDTPALAPGEQAPTFRRRVGTAFSLSLKDNDSDTQAATDLSKLELEVELQGKITSAAQRLASDKTVSKYVRKQRRQSYTRASGKLKEMEKKLGDMRRQLGKAEEPHHHHHQDHHHHHHHTTSRLKDGMYHVSNAEHPPSPTKSPIDLTTSTTQSTLSQEQRVVGSCKDTDSCGNSVYSGDCSLASSADQEDSEGSVNYILHTCRSSTQLRLSRGMSRRVSSRGSSLSASSELSYSISDVSERLDMLMDVSLIHGDSDKHLNSDDDTDTEDYSIAEAERNRKSSAGSGGINSSHFVLNRREDRPRVADDRRKDFSRVRMLAKLEEDVSSENESCASSEYEREDSLKDESVVRSFRPRESSASSTLVERRRKTLITSKRTVSCREMLGRSCSINEGYKVFEKHCLEDWLEDLDLDSTIDLEDSPLFNQRDRGRRFCRRREQRSASNNDSLDDQESQLSHNSRKTSSTDSELDRSHSFIKLTPPLAFSPKNRNNSSCSEMGDSNKQSSFRRPSNDSSTGSELSRTASQTSTMARGRPLIALTSCARRTSSQRSPSPDKTKTRIASISSSNSTVSNTTNRLVPFDDLKPGSAGVKVGRSRHIIYARSKTPDLRRTKSNLSTPLNSAPLVLQEDLEGDFSPVFEEEHNVSSDDKFKYSSHTISFPIRRGLSCPTINRDMSSSSGVETIV